MENELIKNNDEFNSFFNNIKNLVMNSRIKYIRQLIQKFLTYIGKAIMGIQQGDERASYGDAVLEKLS